MKLLFTITFRSLCSPQPRLLQTRMKSRNFSTSPFKVCYYNLLLNDLQHKILALKWIKVPYRTKIRRTKLSKFRPCIENFVRRKILSVENFVQYFIKSQAKIGQNCRNFGLVSKILSDKIFCPTKIVSNEIFPDKV